MLNKEDRLRLTMSKALHAQDYIILRTLYAPLITHEALTLYETFVALASVPQRIKNHLLVQKLTMLSCERIEEQRIVLEQYLLLKTYYDAVKNAYWYELIPPKSGNEFLSHDVFGRLYLRKMGKQAYEYMKRCYAPEDGTKEGYQEISEHMSALFRDWDDTKEEVFTALRPKEISQPLHFNFDLFLNDLSAMILPLAERTKENLDFIAEKADLYGIDEKEMQKLVGKSMDIKKNRLDRKKLIRYMQNTHQELIAQVEDPYALAPIRFLQQKQNGIAVSKSDQNLIDSLLSQTYHFAPQVINVLIEYVLERCDQHLRRAYVEKVAATWVRLGIDTKEKALALIQSENQRPSASGAKKQLPEWFYEQNTSQEEERSVAEDQALMENLRKLREQHG